MKNLKLLIFILTGILLVTTVFAVLPALSQQPPMDTSTMYVGTVGQPKNVDPSQAYDTASGELIMNVYDSMLEFGSESSNITVKEADFPNGIPTIPANDSVDVGTDVARLGATTDVPGVCQLPTITITNATTGANVWTFQVNTNLVFQPWEQPDGTWVIDENITWQDIVYYYERMFVQDSHNSPEWMLMGPALGMNDFDAYQVGGLGGGPSLGNNEPLIAGWISNWVTGWTDADGTQWVQMNFKGPATGMWDILCQTWSCIPPMDFSIEHGCWNDSFSVSPYAVTNEPFNYTQTGFYPGWSALWRRYPSDLFTPLDEHTARSMYSSSTAEPAMCGTGPYSFTTWNQATDQWRIDAFEQCVSHPWPGPYAGEPAPTTVIETGINTWATSKMMFLSGALDIDYVPTANMYDLLQSPSVGNDYTPIPGITLYYDIPELEVDALFYTFNVAAGSPFIPIVNGVADPTLFSNLLVREAFCQAINSSAYLSGAFYDEAIQPNTFWAYGLTPATAYLNSTVLPAWELNEAVVYDDLQAAGVKNFTLDLEYNTGNTQRQIAANEIAETFAEINALHGTSYICNVGSINWPTYLADVEAGALPVWIVGWLADFSDADDFAVPFMASWGAFTLWQGFSNSTIDTLVREEEALSAATPSSNLTAYNLRISVLEQLQIDYVQNAISLPLDQPLTRFWQRNWVYGYYFNQLYPGNYYQDLYKNFQGLAQSSTLVVCSPNVASAGSYVTCTATVFSTANSTPTGTIIWTTSSSTGYFSSSVGTLSSGSCSTTYVDNLTGYVTITASYSGDSNNLPSSGSATLTVNLPTGTDVFVDPQSSVFSNALVGSTFLVNVTVANVTNLEGIEFTLSWNQSLLYCNSMTDVFFHDPLITPPSDFGNIWDLSPGINNTGGTAVYAFTWSSLTQAKEDGYCPANITTTGDAYGIPGYPWPEGKHGIATFNFTMLQASNFTVPVLSCLLALSAIRLANSSNLPISYTEIDGLYQNSYVPPPSSTSVSCSPNSISVGSPAICNATVSGNNPTGTITWTTSSSTGSFSSSFGTLSSGSCSTTYVDNDTGYVTITASYSGDAYNAPSSGSAVLTVFVNVTSGTNVTVTPTNNLLLTFANVTTAGTVVVNATSTVLAPPLDLVGLYYTITVTAGFSGNVTVSVAFNGSNMTLEQKSSLQMMQYTPIPGDILGEGTVDIYDAITLSAAFGSTPGQANYNPLAKLTDPAITGPDINIYDAIVLASHYGETTTWVNITWYVDTTNNIVYGQTTHFSFIGIH